MGTHKLYLSTSGIPRTRRAPAVIFFTGGGVPVEAHKHLQAQLSVFSRVYFYDRAGYDWSESGPDTHPTAAVSAIELVALLRAVKVAPPYVLASHSYGSLIAREFLHLCSSSVVGMVLVDTVTELMYEAFPGQIPSSDMAAMVAGLDWDEITHLQEESKLSNQEWQAIIKSIERTEQSSTQEDTRGGGRPLARKRQFQNQALGDWPLSVIRCNSVKDYRLIYEAGLKAGNGTEEQRAGARNFIEMFELYDDELRAGQLRLSSRNRYRHVADCGHDINVRRPEIIVEEVRWVLEQLKVAGPADGSQHLPS